MRFYSVLKRHCFSFNIFNFIILAMCVHACVWVHACEYRDPCRPGESTISPRAGLTNDVSKTTRRYELNLVFWKDSTCSLPLGSLSSPKLFNVHLNSSEYTVFLSFPC